MLKERILKPSQIAEYVRYQHQEERAPSTVPGPIWQDPGGVFIRETHMENASCKVQAAYEDIRRLRLYNMLSVT